MMTTNEMKDILTKKLKEEGCYFKKSDISIKKIKDCYHVVIKDYEHIPFKISFEYDDYFNYVVWVYRKEDDILYKIINMIDNKKEYDIKSALIYLGYYIGTRF